VFSPRGSEMITWVGAALAPMLLAIGAVPAGAATADGCPSVNGNWAGSGPFAVTVQQSGAGQTIYRPSALGTQGCTAHPVILWGNGTGTTPKNYDALLRHWASHGFIVAAANTRNAYSGKEMVAGLDFLTAQNQTAGSVFLGRVDTAHVAAAGHSQGASGAINAGGDPRVGVTVPIEPAPFASIEALHGPMFILAGQYDVLVSPELVVKRLYKRASQVVAIYGNLAGATHGTPLRNGGGFRGPMTAWLRFELMGDEQARGLFFGPACGYCASPIWTEFLRNAKAQAVSTTNGSGAPGPVAAVVSAATETNKKWRRGKQLASISRRRPPVGTTFKFSLDKAAAVRLAFTQSVRGRKVNGKCVAQTRRNKHKRSCARKVARGSISFAGHSGVNAVHFEGRISRTKTLKPAKYTLVITATTPGVGSTTSTLKFWIVK